MEERNLWWIKEKSFVLVDQMLFDIIDNDH